VTVPNFPNFRPLKIPSAERQELNFPRQAPEIESNDQPCISLTITLARYAEAWLFFYSLSYLSSLKYLIVSFSI